MNVEASSLTKRYGRHLALRNVDFTLGSGVYGLLGPNGAGKTTLIKTLATVMPPTHGAILYDNAHVPGDEHRVRRHLGYLPQIYGLYDHMTGREFLEYAAAMKGMSARSLKTAADEGLQAVNLETAAHRRIAGYSGGMRQRLALAQALIGHPDLLILDEPTSGLDPEERTRLKNYISAYGRTATVLLSTHIVEDLENLTQGILVMGQGEIIARGTSRELRETAHGRTFELGLTPERWSAIEAEWQDLPALSRPTVVSVRTADDGVTVRILAEAAPGIPGTDLRAVEPTLNDGYLLVSRTPTRAADS